MSVQSQQEWEWEGDMGAHPELGGHGDRDRLGW